MCAWTGHNGLAPFVAMNLFIRTTCTPLQCTYDETFYGFLSTHGPQPSTGWPIVLLTHVEYLKAPPVVFTGNRKSGRAQGKRVGEPVSVEIMIQGTINSCQSTRKLLIVSRNTKHNPLKTLSPRKHRSCRYNYRL